MCSWEDCYVLNRKTFWLSVMSGLARNPANREITSSSGASEHQDIFFFDFFSIFFSLHFLKKLGKNMI
jgi:hypothetical protein